MPQAASNKDNPPALLAGGVADDAGVRALTADDRSRLIKVLLFTFLGALLIRALYFLEHAGTPEFAHPMLDQLYYHLFAKAIVSGGDLRQFGGFRPMLYPLFVAFFYWIGGNAGTLLVIVAQHIMGALTAVMTALLGWFLSGRKLGAAILGGILCAIAAPLVYYEGEMLIETLMAFLACAQLLCIAVALNRSGRRAVMWWLFAGVAGGLAAQARPNMLLFFPAYPVMAGWCLWHQKSRRALLILIPVIPILLLQTAFGFINKCQSGRFQFVTSAGGINFYVGNNPRADGMIPRMPYPVTYSGEYRESIAEFSRVEYERLMHQRGETPSTDPKVISDFWYAKTWEEVGENPGRWALLMLKKTALALGNYEISNGESFAFALSQDSLLLRLLPGRWMVLMFLFPAGIWAAMRRGNRTLLGFTLLFLLFYAASFVLYFVNARFRIPLWPAAIAIAACGAEFIIGQATAKNWKAIRIPLGTGGVAAGLSLAFTLLVPKETFAFSYYFRSIANYQKGNYEAAKKDIDLSAKLEAPVPDVIMHMGNVEFALKNYKAALDCYREGARREPYEPRVFNNIGATLEMMKQYQQAYEAYQQALAVAPAHRTALVNMALLELRAGWIEKADKNIALAERSVSQGNDLPLRVARALLISAKGDSQSASHLLDKAAAENKTATEELVRNYRDKIILAESHPLKK